MPTTEFRTDLPGGRRANVKTRRAVVVKADRTGRRVLAEELTRKAGDIFYPTQGPAGGHIFSKGVPATRASVGGARKPFREAHT